MTKRILIALFTVLAISIAFATEKMVVLDDFESGKLSHWGKWPNSPNISFKLSTKSRTGKHALLLDARESSGVIFKGITEKVCNMNPLGISFFAKTAPGSLRKQLTILIQEKSGELFSETVKLTSEWKEYTILFKDMRFFKWGGKTVDCKLDPSSIIALRFSFYPKGNVFLLDDIKIITTKLSVKTPTPLKTVPSSVDKETFQYEVKLDNFESGKLSKWGKWPNSPKISFKISSEAKNGKYALLLDALNSAGVISKVIPYATGKMEPYGISFYAKSTPESQQEKVTILIQETSGERFCKIIKLTPEWKIYTILFKDMTFFKWGGKTLDRKLDPATISALRFNLYPKGNVFLLDDIKILIRKNPVKVLEAVANEDKYIIKKIKLAANYPKHHNKYPKKVQNISIKKNMFMRDGKPYFILGGWQTGVGGPFWIMRILGFDVYPYNATEIYSLYAPVRRNGKLVVEWKANPWYEAIIDRTLKNGLTFWHEHKAASRYSALKRYKEFKDILHAGHFVAYDPYHPRGEEFYREMFKSWMRYTRKYPMFVYELFNEMMYDNTHLISRKAFAQEMKKKYHSINNANVAWGTKFSSFAHVLPPGFIQDGGKVEKAPRNLFKIAETKKYPNLQIDWQKFQEDRSYQAIKKLMPIMRSYDPDKKVFSTVQSHLNLGLDFADIGIKPEALRDFSDFYSHEFGQGLIESSNPDDLDNLMKMLRSNFINDYTRNVCPDKPIFNAEAPLALTSKGTSKKELLKDDLIKQHSRWKFYDGTTELPADWNKSDADTNKWKNISVPGMWGKQGFNKCKVGLYQKKFAISSELLKSGKIVYLNGKALSDSSIIYLNGIEIGLTKKYNEAFSFNITNKLQKRNVLSIKIINNYFRNGMYYGGIRGFVSVNTAFFVPPVKVIMQAKHYRTFLWSQIMHGMSGVMLCYDNSMYESAARDIPRIKASIESVADIIMPRPRIKGKVGMVYPQETMRGIVHKGYMEKLSGPATKYLLYYYTPLLTSQVGVDVIRNKDIVDGKADKYKMLLMVGNPRASTMEIKKLKQYVENGGIVVADLNSLSIDDDSHKALDPTSLFGVKVKSLSSKSLELDSKLTGKTKTVIRYIDKNSHALIVPTSAKVLASFNNGAPAISVNKIGKGKVYYIAGALPPEAVLKLVKNLLKQNMIKPQIKLKKLKELNKPRFVEANLTGKDGRYLLFVLNWGKSGSALAKLNTLPAGSYTIRNINTGNLIRPASKQQVWSATELAKGLPLRLDTFNPVTLLLEKVGLKPLVLKNISPARYRILNQLWEKTPEKADAPTVAVAGSYGLIPEMHGLIPTARKVLTDNGFNVKNYYSGKTDLKKVNVLLWSCPRMKPKNHEAILKFVKNGGGLLICGGAVLNYHQLNRASDLMNKLKLAQTGVRTNVLYNSKPGANDDILNLDCKDLAKHPVTENIKSFKTSACGYVNKLPPNAKVLIRAPKNSNHPGKPVLVTFKYGKGRVIFVADFWWLRPLDLEKADNAQLLYNIVNYLAGKNSNKLNAEQLKRALFITDKTLKQAKKEESESNYIFKSFTPKRSYLGKSGKIQGIGGGDPIVDMFTL